MLLFIWVANTYAQNNVNSKVAAYKPNDSNKVYGSEMNLQLAPKFPGDIIKYFADSIRYPEDARKKNIQGHVYLSFIIEKDGSISTIKVLRADNEVFINEAKRVMFAMPKWRPGWKDGTPVRVSNIIAVPFKL